MHKVLPAFLLFLFFCSCAAVTQGPFSDKLHSIYSFSRVLAPQKYFLHWNFNAKDELIYFAVNVMTNGWVGFGLSPNGKMLGADIVIGWIEGSGEVQFKDRFGFGNFEPAVDESQDWFLTGHSKSNGWTLLEFSRNFSNCDDQDLDVLADTARVIWSLSEVQPSCSSGKCKLLQHDDRGTTSINLLGGLNVPLSERVMDTSFSITNSNVTIPDTKNTTYWCQTYRLPDAIIASERYVHKISPVISMHEFQFVHHMIVFMCPTNVAFYTGECDSALLPVIACVSSNVIGSWAVGGEDFVFPNDVAFPIGGSETDVDLVLEMHYDNPYFKSGIKDSSGMKFYYSTTPPVHRAGILTLGHDITKNMVIPPSSTRGYTTSGLCVPSCTREYFPSDGITIFGNTFHTHLIGRGLILRHYRNTSDCGGWEELPPIDENDKYDFNFQQFNILQQQVKVLPGDALELQCLYRSSRSHVTLGGDGTSEEMCLSFLAYYPSTELSICVSQPSLEAYNAFNRKYIPAEDHDEVIGDLRNRTTSEIMRHFNSISWSSEAVGDLEHSILNGDVAHFCITSILDSNSKIQVPAKYPKLRCHYKQEPKKCMLKPPGTNGGMKAGMTHAEMVMLLLVPILIKMIV